MWGIKNKKQISRTEGGDDVEEVHESPSLFPVRKQLLHLRRTKLTNRVRAKIDHRKRIHFCLKFKAIIWP